MFHEDITYRKYTAAQKIYNVIKSLFCSKLYLFN